MSRTSGGLFVSREHKKICPCQRKGLQRSLEGITRLSWGNNRGRLWENKRCIWLHSFGGYFQNFPLQKWCFQLCFCWLHLLLVAFRGYNIAVFPVADVSLRILWFCNVLDKYGFLQCFGWVRESKVYFIQKTVLMLLLISFNL